MSQTLVEILGKDRTGPAFDSLKRNLISVDDVVGKVSKKLRDLATGYLSFQALKSATQGSLEFRRSLAEISTQIDGGVEDMKRLENAAKSMAVQFGTMPIDQTRAFYEIISAGTEDIAKATELLDASNRLAIAGTADLGVTVAGMTSVMNAYRGQVESASAVSDALVVAMKSGTATIEDFAQGLGRVSALAAGSGVSFDELVGSISALTATGVQSSEAITGVRAVISSIIKPSKEAADLAERLGLEFNAAALKSKGLTAFLEDVRAKTGGATEHISKLFSGLNALTTATALFGNAGEIYAKVMDDLNRKTGETDESVKKLADNQAKIDGFFASFTTASQSLGEILANVLAPAADAAAKAINNLFGLNVSAPTALEQQRDLVKKLKADIDDINETRRVSPAGSLHTMLPFTTTDRELHELESRYEAQVEILNKMEAAAAKVKKETKNAAEEGVNPLAKETGNLGDTNKKTVSESQKFIDALKKQVGELGKSRTEILRMEAARLGVLKVTEPMIDQLEREEEALRQSTQARDEYLKWMRENEAITESVMTATEKYAQIYDDLMSRFEQGGISESTLKRKLEEVQNQLFKVEETGRNSFGNLDQFAVQAARNIQSAFADYLYNPFEKGMKGLVTGFSNSIRRMVAELAALKMTQSLGIGALFGAGSTAAMASGGSGGMDFMSVANLGSTVANAFSTGLGTTGLVGSAVTSLGNMFGSAAVSSFGTGLAGVGIGPVASGATYGSMLAAPGAASMGSAFAAAAGPAIALFAVDQIGRLLAGNKSTGTFVDSVPVIGGFAGALFGRGPLKQRATTLSGMLGTEGFESGALRTDFRAKGGLFRSNKNDFASVDAVTGEISTDNRRLNDFAASLSQAARDIIGLFNETASGVSLSLREIAGNLELGTAGLDAFSREIRLVSENGEFLTDAQIAEEIAAISDELSRSLMPGLDAFSRRGESAFQTISRLNTEFNVLGNSALILGHSVAETRAMISALSIDQRTSFIDAAGGMDALAQKAQFFAENFLDDAERLQPAIEMLDEQMRALGLSSEITKEQFRDLVQSYGQLGGISDELLHSLLNIAPLFARVKDGLAALNPALDESANAARALADAERLIQDRRSALVMAYQRESSELQRMADRYSSLALSLRSASDQMSLSELSPLTPEQRLDEARRQFNRDRVAAFAGDEAAQNRLAESGRAFLQASQVFNASSAEFVSDFNFVKGVLESGAFAAETQADIARRELSYLESSVSRLVDINSNVISVETAIRDLIDATLQGPGNASITGDMIRDFINTPGRTPQEVVAAIGQHGVSNKQISDALGVDPSAINQAVAQHHAISDQQIRDYVYTPGRTEQEIYQAAIANDISSARLAGAIGMSQQEILEIAKRNGWAAFDRGTDYIPRDGLAVLHKGEAVTPGTSLEKMAAEIKSLKETVAALLREISHKTGSVVGAVLESSKINARMIIENNQDMAKSLAWREQTRAHMR